ncbi:MAG: TRAP transporter small permease [Mangrovicoccus sp.]
MSMLSSAIRHLAGFLAVIGGVLLLALAGITVLSVTGRVLSAIGLGPIRGDFELVEIGCAITVFCFLPWCQLQRGQVSVDILADHLPGRGPALTRVLGDLALCLVAGVLLWRIWLGFGEKWPGGSAGLRETFGFGAPPFFAETTYELLIPAWIPLSLCLPGAVLLLLACLVTLIESLTGLIQTRKGAAQ